MQQQVVKTRRSEFNYAADVPSCYQTPLKASRRLTLPLDTVLTLCFDAVVSRGQTETFLHGCSCSVTFLSMKNDQCQENIAEQIHTSQHFSLATYLGPKIIYLKPPSGSWHILQDRNDLETQPYKKFLFYRAHTHTQEDQKPQGRMIIKYQDWRQVAKDRALFATVEHDFLFIHMYLCGSETP